MAFLGQESTWAAEAAECAGEQGQFWAYHDALYSLEAARNSGAMSRANLKLLAASVKLDAAAFGACVDSGRYTTLVRQETEAGRAKGVRATPTLFVNDRKVEGVPGFEQIRQLVELAARSPARG